MPDSARSLYPDAIPSKTPQQPGLTTGPTGVVKHSDRPDNTKFWGAVRKAKTAVMDRPGRVDTLKLRRDILERVMTYCSLTLDRVCYAAVATIAEKEQAGTTSTRGHLRALERDGFLEAVGSRKGGRKTPTTYRPGPWFLHAEAPDEPDVNPTDSERKPNGFRVVNPTDSVAEYSVTKSTYIKAVAAASTWKLRRYSPHPCNHLRCCRPKLVALTKKTTHKPTRTDTPARNAGSPGQLASGRSATNARSRQSLKYESGSEKDATRKREINSSDSCGKCWRRNRWRRNGLTSQSHHRPAQTARLSPHRVPCRHPSHPNKHRSTSTTCASSHRSTSDKHPPPERRYSWRVGLGEAGMGEGRRAGYQGPKDDGLAITRLQRRPVKG